MRRAWKTQSARLNAVRRHLQNAATRCLHIAVKRLVQRRTLAIVMLFLVTALALYLNAVVLPRVYFKTPLQHGRFVKQHWTDAVKTSKPKESFTSVPCVGPRGKLIAENVDDQLQAVTLDKDYPRPVMGGTHDLLMLEESWHSAASRYGLYGYKEDSPDNTRSRVNWAEIDWAQLQNDCAAANNGHFSKIFNLTHLKRFIYRDSEREPELIVPPRKPTEGTGRTAIVFRAWSSFTFTPEDCYNIRSIIAEAALDSGASRAVFLLVDVQGRGSDFLKSQAEYDKILREVIPPEFQNMTVLFDESLLVSWYPLVEEYRPGLQIYQPLQLFAHFYPEYDNYWQLEMDSRFTSHVGHYLNALEQFSKVQPRKQLIERNSYVYIPRIHGSYQDFINAVNSVLRGSGLWGPTEIPDTKPIGPKPPTATPEEDTFEWGVGEDADVIALSKNCLNVSLETPWVYKDWVGGFKNNEKTPRLECPPAMGRASWNVLNAAHTLQITQGARVPSEATPSSFALWHGLKIVRPPQPWYYEHADLDPVILDDVWNGGTPDSHVKDSGMALGAMLYNTEKYSNWQYYLERTTYEWTSTFVPFIYDSWFRNDPNQDNLPWFMTVHEGNVLMPNLMLHPRKTQSNP